MDIRPDDHAISQSLLSPIFANSTKTDSKIGKELNKADVTLALDKKESLQYKVAGVAPRISGYAPGPDVLLIFKECNDKHPCSENPTFSIYFFVDPS